MKTILRLGRRFKSDKGVDLYILNTYKEYDYIGEVKLRNFEATNTRANSEGEILNKIWKGLIRMPSYSTKRKFIEREDPIWFWWIFRRYWK